MRIKALIPTMVGRQIIHEMRFCSYYTGTKMELITAFGCTLRKLRHEKEMTQEQLGIAADVQRKYVSWLERGEKQPTLTTIFKLANALQISPSDLVSAVERQLEASAS